MSRLKIFAVVGTRPEAIKMAPVILRLRAQADRFDVRVCATAQHREMLDSVLRLFGIVPDVDLDLMRPGQTLNDVAGRGLLALDRAMQDFDPEWVLVQGDTTTVLAASLAAFHQQRKIGHVEAGLRTGRLDSPFPEEMNRCVTDLVATALFAPTVRAAQALRREGHSDERILLTGNTVVDALHHMIAVEPPLADEASHVLVTCHRRENFGPPLARIINGLRRLALRFPEVRFIFPVHPNPNVVRAAAALATLPNVLLREPADYQTLLRLLRGARIVITDSGGIQEEAPTFGKPVLVLRDTTERPEAIDAGVAKLIGTDEDLLFSEAERLLTDRRYHQQMARPVNPYGDGLASERIARFLLGMPIQAFVPGDVTAPA